MPITMVTINKVFLYFSIDNFHETISATTTSYFDQRNDAFNFLKFTNACWVISNSKGLFNNNNLLGNAAMLDHIKVDLLRSMADWIDCWQGEWMANVNNNSLYCNYC